MKIELEDIRWWNKILPKKFIKKKYVDLDYQAGDFVLYTFEDNDMRQAVRGEIMKNRVKNGKVQYQILSSIKRTEYNIFTGKTVSQTNHIVCEWFNAEDIIRKVD